ncbi:T9SS type B sorting domain-containing protein [Flagellimonas nanhaiensis]|nr:T9SS type B sorting domain-containing protein [Allomuricauda nanhaiensis]
MLISLLLIIRYLSKRKVFCSGFVHWRLCATVLFYFLCFKVQLHAQQVDNWYSADRAINVPSTFPGALSEFTPYAPADGTPVNVWYELVDYSLAFRQDAMEHPNPLNYDQPWENYPNHGFEHPGGSGFLSPIGAIPGLPTLRRNIMNFNPAIEFDPSGPGDALYFRSHARNESIVFIVFAATGAGSTAETQSLLFGGDIDNHLNNHTNLSLGISNGNRFSIGRTWDTGTFFQSGGVDLLERPTIGTFIRQTGLNQETLNTRVNGLPDIFNLARNHPTADEGLFYYNRMGKHFNDTDGLGFTDPSNLDGHIAEVMLMDGITDANHIQRMESYLAVKYGITLNGAGGLGSVNGNTSYNYLAADGTVIWDFDLANPYNYDIAGIGKDRFYDVPGGNRLRYNLYQRISKSVNTEAIVTMSTNTDFITDNLDDTRTAIDASPFTNPREHNYLLWGNDHASLSSTNVELPLGTVTERISREWKIQKTFSVGVTPISGVNVSIELSGSNITIIPDCALYLMIDTDGDGDFTTGPITYIEATVVDALSRIAEFHNVDFENGEVFTIGYGDFTPPSGSIDDVNVCDVVPPVNTADVYNLDDNCAVDTVTHIVDFSLGGTNPEIITRTYRISDTSGNFTDLIQTINVYTSPDAGGANIVNICVNDPPINLFTSLSGTPDPGGNWVDSDGTGVDLMDPSNVDFMGIPAGMYNFTYTITPIAPSPCLDDSATVTVIISQTPMADAPADVESCDSYILPPLANGAYFDAPNGGGNALSAGDNITATATLYVFSPGTGSCPDTENSFEVTINSTPMADAPADVESCDSYILPPLANGAYFDAPNGGGNALSAGDNIAATATLYVFSPGTGSCPDTENSFEVTINSTPMADAPADVESCDSYILPPLANGAYFDAPNGGGNALSAGDNIAATATLYVFSPGTGSCPDTENSFEVTITGFDISTNIQDETCWESGDGSVTIDANTTGLPLTVQLNSIAPMVFPNNSFVIDNLSSGNYELTIIDNSGCISVTEFEILPGGLNLEASVEPMYFCVSSLPSNSISVNLFDPSIVNDVLYALDSTNPNDFVLSPDFENISAGNHSLSIMHNNGCIVEIPFSIEEIATLNLSLTNDYVNQITANVSGGFPPYTFYFENNNGSSSNTYTITRSGTFGVTVIDSKGCEISTTIAMNLVDISIPNFFTPNRDGQNDFWKPKNMELFPNIETYIFDRYGRKIKLMGPLDKGWDGYYESKALPSGDYWYIVRLYDGSGREFVGHFTLYR